MDTLNTLNVSDVSNNSGNSNNSNNSNTSNPSKKNIRNKIAYVIVGVIVFFGAMTALGTLADSSSLPFRRVAVVRVEEVIIDATWHIDVLRDHLENRNIAGVLLRIDSPGGAVAPSQELYRVVMDYRDAGKPLVVSMGNVAASGGYYIAAPAHTIFALPGTLTGSIGVIATLPNYEELTKKIGIDMRVITSGDLKDAGSPYREMSEREREYFQSLINDTYEQFIFDVAIARDRDIADIREVADGRVFTGRQAMALNMIDRIGSYSDALSYLYEITGIPEAFAMKPLEIKQTPSWRDFLLESAQNILPFTREASRQAGLYYLFLP